MTESVTATGTQPGAQTGVESGVESGAAAPIGSESTASAKPVGGRQLASGGAVLAIAMVVANGANYLLNVALGRWLTPVEFADANLAVTLMLLLTAIAVSFQLIAARFVGLSVASADGSSGEAVDIGSLAGWLERRALLIGLVAGGLLVVGAPQLAAAFRVESPATFAVLGVGMPFYLAQAVGRGVLQGELRLGALASTFVGEAMVRVGAGLVLVGLGFGVVGATAALTLSFVTVWCHVRLLDRRRSRDRLASGIRRQIAIYAGPVAVLLAGQIIVNNGDVLIAKRALIGDAAGVYAAVALVGRAVFFLSWSVATTIFGAVAQRSATGAGGDGVLHGGMVAVAAIGLCATVAAWVVGGEVLGVVFGPAYAEVSGPLGWYAFATSMFAIGNLIASHYLALGQLRESVLIVAGGVFQTVLLLLSRDSLDSLVRAQVIAMAVLLTVTMLSHLMRMNAAKEVAYAHQTPEL